MKSVEYARELTLKAEHDFKAAEIGLAHGAPLDTVCFHLQQAVGKLLKAVIVSRNLEYPLTHHLRPVLNMVAEERPELEGFF